MDLENSVDEVLRKIGRNIMLFQEFEHLLKYIVANSSFSGYASELELKKEQRAASISKQTMGQLVGQYIETTNPENQEDLNEPEALKESFISFKFYTECDSAYFETKKDALARMVFDRNELVHHLLPKFNRNSVESCIQIDKQLDKQREKILCEINELRTSIDSLQRGTKMLSEFSNSEQFKCFFTNKP